MESSSVVIIGAGQAGGEAAGELRKLGYPGRILLVGDEPQVPYRRPPLSKAFLSGAVSEQSLYVTPATALQQQRIEFLGGVRAESIDRARRHVRLSDGRELAYDALVLATGGRARGLSLPGAEACKVHTLRSIADADALRPLFQPGRRALIVGGGFIGLEVAAMAVKHGLRVTLLEGLPRVLARVTAPEVSAFFERIHREAGVELLTGVQIQRLQGGDGVEVVLADGRRIAGDFLIAGIGQAPNTELAEAAGLELDNGVAVDEYCRSSDPRIYAIGDCASQPNARYGRRLRLESVQNAVEQGRIAAASIVGRTQACDIVPWFWSDQYDLKLQMAGLSGGFDQLVMRGDPGSRSFAVFYLKAGRFIAADTVNRPKEFMFARKLLAARGGLDLARLHLDSVPLQQLEIAA
jgi:3-phenylpropionate/trans-cinnamate dioxygenase ferredoxin reductase subunit